MKKEQRRILRKFLFLKVFAAVLFGAAVSANAGDLIVWGKTAALETEQPASWARFVKLKNGEWLAAYAVFGDAAGTKIRVKKSADEMRSWHFVTEFGEDGRKIDNANLVQLSSGEIVLAMRSLIDKKSYRVKVYKSADGGKNFSFLSVIDANEDADSAGNAGVWEPFLIELAPHKLAAFYADETYSDSKPAFSQIISERISTDGGKTWGVKIRVVAEAGKSRPGEPNIYRTPAGNYVLFYEVCGSENCAGHFSTSGDGEHWSRKIGANITNVFQNPQGIVIDNKTWLVTSNNAEVIYTRDGGKSWKINAPAFDFSSWGAFYQISPNEIALVTGTKNKKSESNKLIIRFGKLD